MWSRWPDHSASPETPSSSRAGDSPGGRDLAARFADAVFSAHTDYDKARAYAADLTKRLESYGRTRESLKILPGAQVVLGDSAREAAEKADWIRREARFVHPRAGSACHPEAQHLRRYARTGGRRVGPLRADPRRRRLQPAAAAPAGQRRGHRRPARARAPGAGRLPHRVRGPHPARAPGPGVTARPERSTYCRSTARTTSWPTACSLNHDYRGRTLRENLGLTL
ncbi:LLM class flavin-dependent oxidoreductase [Actinoplanes sp. CA-054009]